MKPAAPLQSIVDPFVKGLRGELVSDLVGNNNPPRNADYLFRQPNVIAELKALEADTFCDSFRRKLGDRAAEWQRRGQLLVYGTARVDVHRLPPECQQELMDLMAKPVQRIVKAADAQIASTKEILGLPAARGLLWIASDGNQDLQPDTVWFLLTRILRKTQEDGSRQYRHIHGMVYFSPRMIAEMPQTTLPVLFWFSGSRDDGDQEMKDLLGMLGTAWPQYVASAQSVQLRLVDKKNTLSDLRFAGPPRPLPEIYMTEPAPGAKRK
jgi:hypothetical protein